MILFNTIVKNLGRLSILGSIVIAPWRNGGFEPLYLRVLLFMILIGTICAFLSLWSSPERKRNSNSYGATLVLSIPLLWGLGLGFLQVVTLPHSIVDNLSPHILELKKQFVPVETNLSFSDLGSNNEITTVKAEEVLLRSRAESVRRTCGDSFPFDESESIERALIIDSVIDKNLLPEEQRANLWKWGRTLSVNPLMTKQILPLFWGAFILFLSSSILFNTNSSRRVLFKTIVFTGLTLALVSLGLKANPSLFPYEDYDYWWLIDVVNSYGPYVNKNAAGGYLVLSFTACFYFVIRAFLNSVQNIRKERYERKREMIERQKTSVYRHADDPRWIVWLSDFFELFNRRLFLGLCVLGVFYASILASLSRGAAVAATVAMLITALLVFLRKETWRFGYVSLCIFIIAFVALMATSRLESVDTRMTTLVVEDELGETALKRDIRWENWEDALKSSRDYRWFGSGLGTYRLANYSNDRVTKYGRLFFYAENSFIQTLLELGWLGLGGLVLEYLMLFVFLTLLLRGKHSVDTVSFAITGIAIVVGQVISSSVDFGIYLPANLFLFSTLCGSCVGRQETRLLDDLVTASSRKEDAVVAVREIERLRRRERKGRFILSFIILFLLSCCVLALKENDDYIVRRDLLRRVESLSEEKLAYMSPNAIDGLIRELREYVSRRDDSFEVRFALANLGLLRFRLLYTDYLKRLRPDDPVEVLWNESLLEYYFKSFLEYQWSGLKIPVEKTRNNSFIRETIPSVAADLVAARSICPLYAKSYLNLLCVVPLCLSTSWEDERLLAGLYARYVALIGPNDSHSLMMAGFRLGRFKLWGLEKKFLSLAVDFYGAQAPLVLEILAETVPAPLLMDSVNETLPDDPKTLVRTVMVLQKSKESPLFRALEAKTRKCFIEMPEKRRDSSYYYWSGFFCNMMGEYETAQEQLARAYELDATNEEAFFLRATILCDRSAILLKDEECVRILTDYCRNHSGQKLWEAEELLERAKKNLLENTARLDARERIRKEREIDEKLRNEVRSRRSLSIDSELGKKESVFIPDSETILD